MCIPLIRMLTFFCKVFLLWNVFFPFVTNTSLKNGFIYFWPCCTACRILFPWPGIEPVLPAVEMWSPNHWTVRELPATNILMGSHFWNYTNSLLLIKLSPFIFLSIQFLRETVLRWSFSESINSFIIGLPRQLFLLPIYVYICMYVYMYVCICMYIWIQRLFFIHWGLLVSELLQAGSCVFNMCSSGFGCSLPCVIKYSHPNSRTSHFSEEP